MALSRGNQTTIQWASSSSKTLSVNTRVDSDAVAFDGADVAAFIELNMDNQGTPASGDWVDVWIKYTWDGTLYETDEHATYLGRWNTYGTDNPGEDPAAHGVAIDCSAKGYKLSMQANQAATRNIVVTGGMHTQRAA